MTRSSFLLFALFAGEVFGQQLSVGVKAGARLNDDIDSWYGASESKRYVVGPMVELSLRRGFGIEIDALYRRFGFRTGQGGFWGSSNSRTRANVWEFPMLAKYRLPLARSLRPYAGVGYAPRRISGTVHSEGYVVDIPTGNISFGKSDGKWNPDVTHGLVAAGGVEFGGRHLRFAPEFRYTHWNKDPINLYGSHGYFVYETPNQMEILVGVTWR